MDPLVVGLEPAAPRPARARRRLVAAFGVGIVVAGAAASWVALRHRPANAELPYYLPTYLPGDVEPATAWSRDPAYGPQDGDPDVASTSVEYGGEVGADGRLAEWSALATGSDTFVGSHTVDVAGVPREALWVADGELRLKLDVPGCDAVEAREVGLTESEFAGFAATARCVDGYVVAEGSGLTELCRVDWAASAAWGASARSPTGNDYVDVRASRNDCPLVAWTGEVAATERIEEIAGRTTVLTIDAADDFTYAHALFRDDGLWVSVDAYFDHVDGVEDEIRRVLVGLERVGAARWHAANGIERRLR